MLKLYLLVAAMIFATSSLTVAGEIKCQISNTKKRDLELFFCRSHHAKNLTGNCSSKEVVNKLIRAEALQAETLKHCGFKDLSTKLEKATIDALQFVEPLSVCLPAKILIEETYSKYRAAAVAHVKKFGCTTETRRNIHKRLNHFQQISSRKDRLDIEGQIVKRLGIRLSTDGTVFNSN